MPQSSRLFDSRLVMISVRTRGGRNYPVPGGMLETAENLRREYSIPRAEQDQLALVSHQRAVAAQRSGVFAEEIVPVTIPTRTGDEVVDTDEHPRADASLEAVSARGVTPAYSTGALGNRVPNVARIFECNSDKICEYP
jgi:acetyl-CoA acetyltransferase